MLTAGREDEPLTLKRPMAREEDAMKKENPNMKSLVKRLSVIRKRRADIIGKRRREEETLLKQEKETLEAIRKDRDSAMIEPSSDWTKKRMLDLRVKISRNETLSKIMGKIPLKDVALVKIQDENIRDTFYSSGRYEKTKYFADPENFLSEHNAWRIGISYLYGGPNSRARVLFRKGENHTDYVCGILMNEPFGKKKAV